MRRAVWLALTLALGSAPSSARADFSGCTLGPSDLNRCSITGAPATLLGAIAAPVLLAGAAVSIANELEHRTEERDVAAPPSPKAKRGQPANLALVPDPPDPYRARAGNKEARNRPSAAFQFNETATNVTTAVAGAMVVGALIATVAHQAHR